MRQNSTPGGRHAHTTSGGQQNGPDGDFLSSGVIIMPGTELVIQHYFNE